MMTIIAMIDSPAFWIFAIPVAGIVAVSALKLAHLWLDLREER